MYLIFFLPHSPLRAFSDNFHIWYDSQGHSFISSHSITQFTITRRHPALSLKTPIVHSPGRLSCEQSTVPVTLPQSRHCLASGPDPIMGALCIPCDRADNHNWSQGYHCGGPLKTLSQEITMVSNARINAESLFHKVQLQVLITSLVLAFNSIVLFINSIIPAMDFTEIGRAHV